MELPRNEDVGTENVRRLVQNNPSVPPEEAARNIDRANFFDMEPDQYKVNREKLDAEVDAIEKVPTNLEEGVRKFASQSEQHASLIKEDYSKLNFIEKRFKYYKERMVDLPDLRREMNELYRKEMSDEGLTSEEEEYLDDLLITSQEMEQRTYGIDSEGEKFTVEAFSGAGDILRSYWENKGIIAGSTAAGAGLGTLGTLAIPVPGARVVGAGAGAVSGLTTGIAAASYWDAFQETRASVYGELKHAVDDNGQPLNIEKRKMKQVSYGVGIITGVAAGISGKILSSNNPLMKKFISSKTAAKTITKNPALLAKMQILGSMGVTAVSEGGEEGLQELIQIIGVNFGKLDESEASFVNAINNSLTDETLSRVGKAAALGAASGSIIQAGSGAIAYKGNKRAIEKSQLVANTLSKHNNLVETAAVMKVTKANELSPSQFNNFMRSLIGIDQEVLLTIEDMQKFADTPEKKELIKKHINPELIEAAEQLNTTVGVPEVDAVKIIAEDPTFADYLRIQPEAQNSLEIRTEAQEHAARLDAAETRREEIESNLGVDQPLSPEDQAEIDAILNPEGAVEQEIENETDYYKDIAFEPIEGIVSQEDVEVLNTKELDARLEIAKNLNEEVDARFERLNERISKDIFEKQVNNDIKNLDKEFKIIERYTNSKESYAPGSFEANVISKHKKKGYGPLAIDPNTLPEDLKEIYFRLGGEKARKRKVFVEGGLHIEDATDMAGVDSPDELLSILINTPSKAEIKQKRKIQKDIETKNKVEQTTNAARLSARDKAFTQITKNRLKQMKYFRNKEWTTLKRGVIKIVGKTPTIEGINRKAKNMVNKTKLADLKPKKFEYGEINSRKKAMDNWLKTEFEQSYKNLEASALNNELRRETIAAKEKVMKYQKFWKRIKSESNQKALKDAGLLDAMEEFTDVYKMSTSSRGLKELKSFNKFIKEKAAEGDYTPVIPDRLNDVTKSAKDMTVEQYLAISEMGEYILHKAKLKNKLLKAQEERAEIRTQEKIAKGVKENLEAHPAFNPKKALPNTEKYKSDSEAFVGEIGNKLATTLSYFNTIKSTVLELDNFVLDGFFQKNIADPIKKARDAKRNEIFEIEKADRKIINEYGMKKFQDMFNEFLEIPEFRNIPTLGDGNGTITKINLLTLMAYTGDPEGRKSVENFVRNDGSRLTMDEVTTVLNRELDERDAALVQSLMVDRFKRFEQRSFDLHKKTAGVEPNMVKGVGITHRGKTLPGGYYPISRQIVSDDVKAARFLEKVKSKVNEFTVNENEFFAKFTAAEMTEQGRLKNRTGSDRPLDLEFSNVFKFTEEAIHDLNFRETGIDLLKILKNPENVKNMKSVLGTKRFVNLLNSVKDVISKDTEHNGALFAEQESGVTRLIDKAHNLHAVKTIGFNYTSALIQPDALLTLGLRAGPKTNLYLLKTAKKLSQNLVLFDEYSKIAETINPDIKFEKDGIDNAIVKQSYEFIPNTHNFFKTYNSKRGKKIAAFNDFKRKAIDASFGMIREGDRINRILATLALSEQFLNGDMKGWDKKKVDALSPKERTETMKRIVRQVADLSLTAAAPEDKAFIEKNSLTKLFARYWTDRRNRLNSLISVGQQTKHAMKDGNYREASQHMLHIALVSGVSLAFMDMIRNGFEETYDKLKKKDTPEEIADFAAETAWHFAKAPVNQVMDLVPMVDAMNFARNLETRSDYRNVSVPLFGVASDVTMGVIALNDALNASLKVNRKGVELRNGFSKISDVQQKALLTNLGYISGGAPTNVIFKIGDALTGRESRKVKRASKKIYQDLKSTIDLFIEENEGKPDTEKFINDLKDYRDNLLPVVESNVNEIVPEDTKDTFKQILSGGEWDAFNSDNGAAGVYQFTEERWNEIIEQAPFLGLTENGRVSENTAEQEKAMDWNVKDISRTLMSVDIPVNKNTIFGSHKFGIDNYIIIHEGKPSDKLSNILGESAKDPMFKKFKTVKSIKKYIDDQLTIEENNN